MASQVPPKKNTAFNYGLCLYKTDGTLIANPGTVTAKISKDFGDYADVGTVSEEDSTYGQLKLALTTTEMNADVVMLYVVDNTSGCVPHTATIYTAANLLDDIKTETAAILADTGTDGVVLAADAITAAKIADNALSTEHLAAALYTRLGIVAYGTAQAAAATSIQLAAASAFADDELNGSVVVITGGTGVGQSRVITNYTSSTDTADVDTWTTTPSGTITYVVFAAAPASATSLPAVNVTQWLGSACATPTTGGVPEVDLTHIAGAAVSATTAQLGVNVVNAAGTAWGSGAITTAALADDAGAEIADAVLNRDLSTGIDSGSATVRTLRQAVRFLRNKWSISGTTLTVTKEDDTTASWTTEISTTEGADPVTGSDPASS